jgi:hypothetical protein
MSAPRRQGAGMNRELVFVPGRIAQPELVAFGGPGRLRQYRWTLV